MSLPCLFRACHKGDLTVVVQHASLNFPGPKVANNDASALYIACCEGHTDIVRVLLESQQFDPNKKNYKGYSPLYAAWRKKHMDIYHMLRKDPRTDINTMHIEKKPVHEEKPVDSYFSDTMIKSLLQRESFDINTMLKVNKPINSHCSDDMITALLQHKSFDVNQRYFLEYKEGSSQKRCFKTTFLYYAMEEGNSIILETVMKLSNLNPNVYDRGIRNFHIHHPFILSALQEKLLLFCPKIGKYPSVFQALLHHPNLRPNTWNEHEETFLYQLIQKYAPNHRIHKMLSHRPDIKLNVPNKCGQTVFNLCVKRWESKINFHYIHHFMINVDYVVDELNKTLESKKEKEDLRCNFRHVRYDCRSAKFDKCTLKYALGYMTCRIKSVFMPHIYKKDAPYWDKKIEEAARNIPFPEPYLIQMLYTYEIVRQKKLPHEMFKEIFKWLYIPDKIRKKFY